MSITDAKKQRIFEELKNSEKSSTDLLNAVKEGKNSMSKDTLYKHLKELELMGIIEVRRDDSTTPSRKYYKLVDKNQKAERPKIQTSLKIDQVRRDIEKMSWLRANLNKINSIDVRIQRTYGRAPSLFFNKEAELKNLFERFSDEVLQVIQDLQGKYPRYDFKYGDSTFFEEAYSKYDEFRDEHLRWLRYKGIMGKLRQEIDLGREGKIERAVDASHDFTTHISKFFVEWKKHRLKSY